MVTSDDRRQYRELIDALVEECRTGQGSIGSRRARAGVWNPYASRDAPEQHAMNDLLRRLSKADREVVAIMLQEAFESGVHTSLAVLHARSVPPFEDGYEGTPFHDFVGRLTGWEWPVE